MILNNCYSRSTLIETERQISADDNDVMVYNRVSCNLMADPDIQNALNRSASAENLPKKQLFLKVRNRLKKDLKKIQM